MFLESCRDEPQRAKITFQDAAALLHAENIMVRITHCKLNVRGLFKLLISRWGILILIMIFAWRPFSVSVYPPFLGKLQDNILAVENEEFPHDIDLFSNFQVQCCSFLRLCRRHRVFSGFLSLCHRYCGPAQARNWSTDITRRRLDKIRKKLVKN